jgi:hypothetical protein
VAQVRARVWSCGICGGQSGAGAGFLPVLRFPLPIFIPSVTPQSPSSMIWGWYNRPVVAVVPSGLSLTPLRRRTFCIWEAVSTIHTKQCNSSIAWKPQDHCKTYLSPVSSLSTLLLLLKTLKPQLSCYCHLQFPYWMHLLLIIFPLQPKICMIAVCDLRFSQLWVLRLWSEKKMLCSFGGTCCLHLQDICSTLVPIFKTTWCHIPEDHNICGHISLHLTLMRHYLYAWPLS